MASHRRFSLPFAALLLLVVATATGSTPGHAAQEPTTVPWTNLLPPLSATYTGPPDVLCPEGQLSCVDAVIDEMNRRFGPLVDSCDHNVIAALLYLRTTERYRAFVTDQPDAFTNPPAVNRFDTNFANSFFTQYDAWRAGRLQDVAPAWQVAFDAADHQRVTATGNALLMIIAHIARDMPFVLERTGSLVYPDGTSGKPDVDASNTWLIQVNGPALAEGARRFDPTLDDGDLPGTTIDTTLSYQTIQVLREEAWRNAEQLAAARQQGPDAYLLVAQRIELAAVARSQVVLAAMSYPDPAARDARNAYCADHHYDT